ncbi:apolipoprotein N-acyltransferase [Leptospira sp. WS92.C1]
MILRFVQKDSVVYRLLLCLGVGLGTLFGLSPYSFLTAGIIAAISTVFFFLSLNKESPWAAALWLLILSQILNYTTFYWIPGSVSRISGTDSFVSILFFLFYGLISHLKFFSFYFIFRFFKVTAPDNLRLFYIFPTAGTLADMTTYQIFPWYWGNLISGSIVLEQFASIGGVYGLSFLLLFLSSVILIFTINIQKRESIQFRTALLSGFVMILVYFYGLYRIGFGYLNEEKIKKFSILLVQPNTSPGTKNLQADETFLSRTMSKVLSLALRESENSQNVSPNLIILPESAIPFHGTIDSDENKIKHIYSPTMEGLVLYLSKLTGADVLFNELNIDKGKLRNQISLFRNRDGKTERYDKRKLLPFGEYLPLEKQFPILRSIFKETSFYVPGEFPKILHGSLENRIRVIQIPNKNDLNQLSNPEKLRHSFTSSETGQNQIQNSENSYSILPLLCYEAMFTELVLDYYRSGKHPPEVLINLTNDSWFDSELEAYQHSGTVRLRAIETGLPMIRSAVSGITEVWDSRGISRIQPIGFHETDIRAIEIEIKTYKPTVYTRFGAFGIWIVCLFIFTLSFLLESRTRKEI